VPPITFNFINIKAYPPHALLTLAIAIVKSKQSYWPHRNAYITKFLPISLDFSLRSSNGSLAMDLFVPLSSHVLSCDFVDEMFNHFFLHTSFAIMSIVVRTHVNLTKTKKGKNFKAEEESQLCRSFLHVSQDPIVGNGECSITFWE
jgi:hypothetical protein